MRYVTIKLSRLFTGSIAYTVRLVKELSHVILTFYTTVITQGIKVTLKLLGLIVLSQEAACAGVGNLSK